MRWCWLLSILLHFVVLVCPKMLSYRKFSYCYRLHCIRREQHQHRHRHRFKVHSVRFRSRSCVHTNAFKCIIFTALLQTNGIISRFAYTNLQNMLASIGVNEHRKTAKLNTTTQKKIDRETNTTDTHTLLSPKYISRNQCTYSLWRVVCINFRPEKLWLMWKMHFEMHQMLYSNVNEMQFFFLLSPHHPFRHPVCIFSVLALRHNHTSNMAEIFSHHHF